MKHQYLDNTVPLEVDSEQTICEGDKIPSAVLRRLVEEVRTEKMEPATTSYNRTHNRHNRGR